MSKRLFILLVLYLLITFASNKVYAGDIPESIMYGDQKAVFIGVIDQEENNTFTVNAKTILMGSMDKNPIVIKKFERYYGNEDKPMVGDIIVIVLVKENIIDDMWIFKATSEDYKTLELVSQKHDMVQRYEKYINEGKYQDAQKRTGIEQSKKQAELAEYLEKNERIINKETLLVQEQNDEKNNIEHNRNASNNNKVQYISIVLVIIVIIGIIILIINNKK